jgi:hypothetical protein
MRIRGLIRIGALSDFEDYAYNVITRWFVTVLKGA